MDSMREIVWSLNTTGDSLQNIDLRIRETAHALFDDGSTTLHIDLPPADHQPMNLSGRQRRELFLIAKECLTNIVRHARASHVRIHLKADTNQLKLRISDDGIGFNADAERSGLGLDSIRHRAERLNACLSIQSVCGAGCTITVDCPMVGGNPIHAVLLSQDYD